MNELTTPNDEWLKVLDSSPVGDHVIVRGVLEGNRPGVAIGNDDHCAVISRFGFAQLISASTGPDASWIDKLLRHELVRGRYLLIYDASATLIEHMQARQGEAMRVRERMMWRPPMNWSAPEPTLDDGTTCIPLTARNAHLAEVFQLDLGSRFWNSMADALQEGIAVVALIDDKPAALCYSAGESNGVHEVDVVTLPEHRGKGLGRSVTAVFMQRCQERGQIPNWDCFTANAPSMALACSCGLGSVRTYQFLTFKA